MGGMAMDLKTAGGAKIVLQFLDNKGNQNETVNITDGQNIDHHAMIAGYR